MKTSRPLKLWALILVCVWGLTLPVAHGADVANKREIVQQARQAYYSLQRQGLLEFQTSVQPNWRLVLKEQLEKDPKSAEVALKLLNGIHFTLKFAHDGAVSVTHRADVAAPNPEAAKGFEQIFSGMEQAMSGFFDTWKPFMFTTPFPEVDSLYQVEDTGTEYVLTYKDGDTDVTTTMSKQLVIREMKIVSPTFISALRPQFTRSPQGLLLTGYDATYREPSGSGAVTLKVQIGYQDVSGLQLPGSLTLNGSYEGTPFNMEMAFKDYSVKNQPVAVPPDAAPKKP